MNKQVLFSFFFFLSMGGVYAQQKVFDGTVTNGSNMPNANAILELESKNKGLLFSRVELSTLESASPLTAHVAGIMVYNTATNDKVKPGIYYNNGVKWVAVGGANATANINYDPVTNVITYVDESNNPVTINLQEIIKGTETITLLDPKGNGLYTYFNEKAFDGTGAPILSKGVDINVTQDVIDNFETIINNQSVTNLLKEVEGAVYYDGTSFTYTKNGSPVTITFEEMVQSVQTVTVLKDNLDGTYTYYNEVEIDAAGQPVAGTGVKIDIPASVIQNFTDIISNEDVKNEIINVINNSTNDGNVTFDGSEFTYKDASGTVHPIDLNDLVKQNQTVTVLKDNLDGTYTYYNEVEIDAAGQPVAGTGVKIDIPASVIQNFTDIISNEDVKNEIINVINNSTNDGNVTFDGSEFTYKDASGTVHPIDLNDLVKQNQTVTVLKDNLDGTYTYYNEVEIDAAGQPVAGTGVKIDIPASVIQNFTDIISNEDVKNEIINVINNSTNDGNVTFDGSEFTYKDASGTVHPIDLNDLVKQNQTVTVLKDNLDGTYTYYNEVEIDAAGQPVAGTGVKIDIPASVIQNFTDIISNEDVKNEIINVINNSGNDGNVTFDGSEFTYKDASGTVHPIDLNDLVKQNQTVTVLKDNLDGTYTYYNEVEIDAAGQPVAGTGVKIDIPASVIQNFTDIISNEDVKNEIINVINNSGNDGNVTFDGSEFTYKDASGTVHPIDLTELAQIDYKEVIQNTGRKWLSGTNVKEITLTFNWAQPNVEHVLPATVPADITIIGIRLINKATNSVSTNLVSYNAATKTLLFGTAGSVVGVHPAGEYYLIVEYVEN